METVLNDAIASAMKIDFTMRAILCANVQLRDKIHILRTIVGISTIAKSEKTRFDKALKGIATHSLNRNMMAHDAFGPDDEGNGVLFLQVKAKGNFSQPKIIWTTEQFLIEYQQIDGFRKLLSELQTALVNAQFSFRNFGGFGDVDWRTAYASMPIQHIMSSGLMDYLSPRTPLPLAESQASPKKDARILPKLRKKR
jgi:hypothetical protein